MRKKEVKGERDVFYTISLTVDVTSGCYVLHCQAESYGVGGTV